MKNTYYENIIQRRTGELYDYRTKIDFKKKKLSLKRKDILWWQNGQPVKKTYF